MISMTKRTPAILTTALLIISLIMPACGGQKERSVNHIVLVWFQEENKPLLIENAINESLKLRQIKEVKSIHIGKAIESKREIADSSYDLGILMKFDSVSDMQSYLDNPLHTQFFNNFIKGKTAKIVVYDF